MKTYFNKTLIAGLFLIAITSSTLGQGSMLIAQHTGANDPTTEMFSLGPGVWAVGPTNELGTDAWSTRALNGQLNYYTHVLTSQQQAELAGANWDLSVSLRVVGQPSNGLFVDINTGSTSFQLLFGNESNEDPYVTAGSSTYILNGAGATYNNYQLVYDASIDTATLWVNGIEEIGNVTQTQTSLNSLVWGVGWNGLSGIANWSVVSFEVIPEPSAISLIFMGSGVLFYVRRLRRK